MALLMRALLCAALLAGWSGPAAAEGERAGVIEYLKGRAEVVRGDATMPAAVGLALRVGDEVRTAEDARLRMRMRDGSAVQLGANAAVRISRYARKPVGALDALLDLIRGRARFIVEKLKRAESRYRVRTRAVLIGVRGTDILAQAEAKAVHVALVEGRVMLTPPDGGAGVRLARGGYVRVSGAWPVNPVPIPDAWLMDFIRDVGTSREGARRKKGDGSDEDAPAEVLRSRSSGQLGAPLVLPR
ncbi:MAG: FecR family protein [Mariprofundaceae bacterium]